MRKLQISVAMLLLLLTQPGVIIIQASGGGGGGGQAYVDTFTRGDNTLLYNPETDPDGLDCDSAGDTCEWDEFGGNTSIVSNQLDPTAASTWRVVNGASGADADTLSQYVAAQFLGTTSGNAGVTLRDEGVGTGGHFYAFRFNAATHPSLRSCNGSANCYDIEPGNTGDIEETALGAGDDFASGDSLGFAVDSGTGDSVVFSLWKWDGIPPPARGSWGTPDLTVCASGCDLVWDVAPTATTAGASDSGLRGGIYDGSAGGFVLVDNWMFGDNP